MDTLIERGFGCGVEISDLDADDHAILARVKGQWEAAETEHDAAQKESGDE